MPHDHRFGRKVRETATKHSRSRDTSHSPSPEQKKKFKHKHRKSKKSKSKSGDCESSHRASVNSYGSEPECSAESTASTKYISKKKHKRAKQSKNSRWEPLPLDIIEDYKQDNDPFRPLTDFVEDRLKLAKETLKSVNMAIVNEILPEFKNSSDEEREKVIYEMLKFMSRKRIMAILKRQELSDSSTTNTDEGNSSVEEKSFHSDHEEVVSYAEKLTLVKAKTLHTKKKTRKKRRKKIAMEDTEELEDGEIRSGSEERMEKETRIATGSTCTGKCSTSQSHPRKGLEIEMPNLQPVSPCASPRSVSTEREIADSTAADNNQQNQARKKAESQHSKQSTDARQSLPQQVPAISTTTTGIEDTDKENDSEEYPEYPDFQLE